MTSADTTTAIEASTNIAAGSDLILLLMVWLLLESSAWTLTWLGAQLATSNACIGIPH